MKREAAKCVPHLLTEARKKSQLNACRELKEQFEVDPNFFDPDHFADSSLVTKVMEFPDLEGGSKRYHITRILTLLCLTQVSLSSPLINYERQLLVIS